MPTTRYTFACGRLTITITRSQDTMQNLSDRAWLVIVDLGTPRIPPQAKYAASPRLAKAVGLQLARDLYAQHNLKPPTRLAEPEWEDR